ncbi:MAG: DUF3565 domain-containing protein [Actinomycetota bacterium]|nr:DUF3565 domain-containing protein [Actinomycetota bacterium]
MVDRRITGLTRGGDGEWVAELSCGHRRGVRHRPAGGVHPSVLDETARAPRLGSWLDCPSCEDEPEGGEMVCYAALVCPECGDILDDTHRDH